MKREILFRGKRIDNGEWVEGDLIQLHENAEYWYILPDSVSSELYEKEPYPFRQNDVMCEVALAKVIPETVGEYTGLTDKNGKRIFKGDIVDVAYDINYTGVAVKRIGHFEVVFDNGCFMKKKIGDVGLFHFIYSDVVTVIGNIHDNKLEDFTK